MKGNWVVQMLLAAGISHVTVAHAAPDGATAGPSSTAAGVTRAAAWEVRASDVTLARTLERWASVAGYKLKWDASRNFLIGAPDEYVGTFEEALQHILHSPGIRYSDYPLEACVYANTPPLVRITRLGEQRRECDAAPTPTP